MGAQRHQKGAIKKIEQLAGKRIGVIGRTQANVNLLKIILTQSGVDADKVHVIQFTTTGFADAIKNEKFDAFFAVGPLNSKINGPDAIAATTKGGRKQPSCRWKRLTRSRKNTRSTNPAKFPPAHSVRSRHVPTTRSTPSLLRITSWRGNRCRKSLPAP